MLRPETKVRARALQLLYAWEQNGRPPLASVVSRLAGVPRGRVRELEGAEAAAQAVCDDVTALDDAIAEATEGWRLSRVGIIERNILRLGLRELRTGSTPPKVVINESVRLAQWFGGGKAPTFVNGVLDALARRDGYL